MPKITVISPVYNEQKYIQNFITSLNNQSFKDFELLIINDGSTDHTYEVAQEALKKTNINYKIINKRQGGQSSARNLGIQKATGEYIVTLDGDDTIQKNYLNNLYYIALQTQCEVAICNLNLVSEKNIFEESDDYFHYDIKTGKETFCNFILHKIAISPCTLLIKKQHLLNLNLLYDEKSNYSEEFIFICSLLHNTNKIVHLQQRLYNYCLRSGSISTNSNKEEILNGYHEIIKSSYKFNDCGCEACKLYSQYAIPRWILASAHSTTNNLLYKDWISLMNSLHYKQNIKKLYKLNDLKVITCTLFLDLSPRLTYFIFSKYGGYK